MGLKMTKFEQEEQLRFERLLKGKIKKDTAYTTSDIYFLFMEPGDPTLNLSQLRKKLFRATINEKINHIQKDRLHFWAIGELVLRHET